MKKYVFLTACMLILCIAAVGQEQTRGVRITIKTDEGEELPLYQNSYALVIGISDYTEGWPDLPNATKDAIEVSAELEEHGFETVLLQNPTRRQLDDAFSDFIYRMGLSPGNRLLLYFAGHGYTMQMAYGASMGYIVPADAPLPNVDQVEFRRKAISMQAFESNARQIQAKHVLYLFDSCFSGSIFALSRAVPSAISYKTTRPVRQFITAGDEGEEVPDKSVFKSQFVEALNGSADLNSDGYITGTEMGEFLQTTVVNYSKESQHPQYGKIRDPNLDKGDYVFVVTLAEAAEEMIGYELIDYDSDLNLVTFKITEGDVGRGDMFQVKKRSRYSSAKDYGISDKTVFEVRVEQVMAQYAEASIIQEYYEVSPQSLADYYALKIAFGTLKIKTEPWATVYLDGEQIGFTPIIIQGVKAGEHTLRFEFKQQGHLPQTEIIMVEDGQTLFIDKIY